MMTVGVSVRFTCQQNIDVSCANQFVPYWKRLLAFRRTQTVAPGGTAVVEIPVLWTDLA
eukprot:SAG31_NODE_14498_length_803_cov_1.161932_1_plen_58_part_10